MVARQKKPDLRVEHQSCLLTFPFPRSSLPTTSLCPVGFQQIVLVRVLKFDRLSDGLHSIPMVSQPMSLAGTQSGFSFIILPPYLLAPFPPSPDFIAVWYQCSSDEAKQDGSTNNCSAILDKLDSIYFASKLPSYAFFLPELQNIPTKGWYRTNPC